jgi:hypothetical protein
MACDHLAGGIEGRRMDSSDLKVPSEGALSTHPRARRRRLRLVKALNAPFTILLLGTIGYGVVTQMSNCKQQQQQHAETIWEAAQRSALPAIQELDYRLDGLFLYNVFESAPLRESRSRAKSQTPILGHNPPKDYPLDAGAGFVIWLDIQRDILDNSSVIPAFKAWTFMAVLTEVRSTLALLPGCATSLESFSRVYEQLDANRDALERAVRFVAGAAPADEIYLEVFVPVGADGGPLANQGNVTGLVYGTPIGFAPAADGGVVRTGGFKNIREAQVLDELAPLTVLHIEFLNSSQALRSSLSECVEKGR